MKLTKDYFIEGKIVEAGSELEITIEAKKKEKDPSATKVINAIEKGFGDSAEDKTKILQLFKGLIFSDDKKAKEFMKKLDKATTNIAKEVTGEKKEKKKESYTLYYDREDMPDDLKIYLENYIEEFYFENREVITDIGWAAMGISQDEGTEIEGAYIETGNDYDYLDLSEKKKEAVENKGIDVKNVTKLNNMW